MLSSAQGLLIGVVIVLTALLVVIGIQVVNILREIKKSLEKVNKMLDDARVISGSVAETVAGLSSFLDGVKGGFKVLELAFDFFKQRGRKEELKSGKKKEESETDQSRPEDDQPLARGKKKPSRFFHRRGEKLS